MERIPVKKPYTREEIHTLSDANANLFNLKRLGVIAGLALVVILLNEFGLFVVEKTVLGSSMALAAAIFLLPVCIFLVHDKLRKKQPPVLEHPRFRTLIILCAFLGIGLISVTLSFHVVVFLAIPILMAAQYSERRREFFWVMAGAALLVPIGVYGGYFFGSPDQNFLQGALTEEEALILRNRFRIATPQRMWELFLHYVLPRLFGVLAITALAAGITRRNARMMDIQIQLSEQIRQEMNELHAMQSRVIEVLANLIETRDASTGTHIVNTKRYVEMIARAMQREENYRDILTDEVIRRLVSAAPLHDVGKIVVPDAILLKPGKLTPEEFDKMKTHTTVGRQVIEDFFAGMEDREFLKTAEEIAVAHHEKWDGSGYPNGLKGEQIPLSARIMAVADVFDALVSVRVYKNALPPEKALEIIYEESGTHFDPEVIRATRTVAEEMIALALARDGK